MGEEARSVPLVTSGSSSGPSLSPRSKEGPLSDKTQFEGPGVASPGSEVSRRVRAGSFSASNRRILVAPVASLLDRIDAAVGSTIESAIVGHHRRRLRRRRRLTQLEPPEDGSLWAAGDPSPREGGDLEVLVDGEVALTRIADALAGARESVHIAGWHVTPGFELTRSAGDRPLRELLGF